MTEVGADAGLRGGQPSPFSSLSPKECRAIYEALTAGIDEYNARIAAIDRVVKAEMARHNQVLADTTRHIADAERLIAAAAEGSGQNNRIRDLAIQTRDLWTTAREQMGEHFAQSQEALTGARIQLETSVAELMRDRADLWASRRDAFEDTAAAERAASTRQHTPTGPSESGASAE